MCDACGNLRPAVDAGPAVPGVSRRRFLQVAAGVGALAAVPALGWSARADEGDDAATERDVDDEQHGRLRWIAGDFHCHTIWSHDVWGGPTSPDDNTSDPGDYYTFGWTPAEQIGIAESRGLDFLAITDHNRIDHITDPEYASSDRLTIIPAYEHSLRNNGGHAGVFLPTASAFAGALIDDTTVPGFVAAIQERGGIAVINHPFYGNKGTMQTWMPTVDESVGFDAVEVWNSAWALRHVGGLGTAYDDYLAMQYWEEQIVPRRHLAAVGGSDNHWRASTPTAGVGQPTTWVLARDTSVGAIFDAVRRGRTTVSGQPPALLGPRLYLDAAEDWKRGRRAILGGSVRALGQLAVTIRIVGGLGRTLRLVSTHQTVAEQRVMSNDTTVVLPVVLPENGWVRAELFEQPQLSMSAFTSPIYARGVAPAFARAAVTTGPAPDYTSPADPVDAAVVAVRKLVGA